MCRRFSSLDTIEVWYEITKQVDKKHQWADVCIGATVVSTKPRATLATKGWGCIYLLKVSGLHGFLTSQSFQKHRCSYLLYSLSLERVTSNISKRKTMEKRKHIFKSFYVFRHIPDVISDFINNLASPA